MPSTATKSGHAVPYGTGAEYAIYCTGPYVSPTGYIHKTVKPLAGHRPKPSPAESQPEPPQRVVYPRFQKRLRLKEKSFVVRAVARGATYAFVQVVDAPVERAEPDPPLKPSPARIAKKLATLKAISKHVEHLKYLDEVSTGDHPLITPETASLAVKAWGLIWAASGGKMPVPAACTGPDGQMLYAWDQGRHHLELEIIPLKPAEFFYKDRQTRELWGEDYTIGDPIPAEAVEKFRFFM